MPPVVLGDWRAFRARLVEGGLPVVGEADSATSNATKLSKPKAKLDEANVALAKSQSLVMAAELSDPGAVWAHEVSSPEVGCLLIRLPLEAAIVLNKESHWGGKLREFAQSEQYNERRRAGRKYSDVSSEERRVDEQVTSDSDDELNPLSEVLLYRVAQRFLARQFRRIADKGTKDEQGRLMLDARLISEQDKELLEMRQVHLAAWQEVILVTQHDGVTTQGVVINRPAATSANAQLSAAIVAALESDEGADRLDVQEFDAAFGDRCAAYVGRTTAPPRLDGTPREEMTPHNEIRAMLLHGLPGLDGARELSPGLGIYRGGAVAAARRVQTQKADAFDFRFFIGEYAWQPGEVAAKITAGQYRAVACSRAIALKQCLGLPKPLWNELMEMLGGSLAEISKLERLKSTNDDFANN